MSQSRYRSAPLPSTTMPSGIPFIVGNEVAERFSFYGMRAILVIFMTQNLLDASGQPAPMSEAEALTHFHQFNSAVYFFPILGALLSDGLLGKYRTIMLLSLVYCLGHLALAVDQTRLGLVVGLGLIAVGAGGIKPCVSAHVGDQFAGSNEHLLPRVFSYFYFAINLGAFASMILTPLLLEHYGPHVAFGTPGVLMLAATGVFWMGRHHFAHVPPGGIAFLRETFSREGMRAIAKLCILYAFVAIFWALFDQTGSAWVLQAERMDRHFLGVEWLSSQIQAVNPLLVMFFIALFNFGVYPFAARFGRVTPLRKIATGFFITVLAFLIPAWIEWRIGLGETPSIAWQLLAYVIMTAAEVLVSITCLEFSYTQAPRRMKSLVMGCFLLSVSFGNAFTAAVNLFIQNPDGSSKLAGPDYYLFFAATMALAALLFVPVAATYRERRYIQESSPDHAL
ncbi:MAG: POT family MFS transporter [Deltaproteobacteria bacterium]|nr:POT family MFS transporter [Deltaproteobacteria bacterium]MBW2417728.1 POT family MFS transporter [Deltaproteobacteria bacterium]